MYIVGFNGPPYSGKDTLARMLAEHMDSLGVTTPVIEASLSTPLRRLAYCMVGETYDPLNHADYTEFKETRFDQFGCTGRQLMIDVSEGFLKKFYGTSVMANMLLKELAEFNGGFDGLVLVRDSGFQVEVDPLINAVGAENLYVARVVRNGCSFKDDSREWVYHEGREGVWYNNGSLELLRTKAAKLYEHLVNQLGWKL